MLLHVQAYQAHDDMGWRELRGMRAGRGPKSALGGVLVAQSMQLRTWQRVIGQKPVSTWRAKPPCGGG